MIDEAAARSGTDAEILRRLGDAERALRVRLADVSPEYHLADDAWLLSYIAVVRDELARRRVADPPSSRDGRNAYVPVHA